ncbi:MAG: hypothetical protein U0640_08010 [Phycisphaerales bacterium]
MNNSQQVRRPRKAPPFSLALDRIAETGTTGAERAVLLAAVRWANKDTGQVWAAVDKWAKYAGVSVRTQQRAMRSLCAKGIVQVHRMSDGGGNRTTVYIIPLFIETSAESPVSPVPPTAALSGRCRVQVPHRPPKRQSVARGVAPSTPSLSAIAPVTECFSPRHGDTQNTREAQRQQPTAAAAVLRAHGIGEELLTHVNATPERLEWLASQVASRTLKNPAGFVAAAIAKGWNVPTKDADTRATNTPGSKAKASRARVQALPLEQQQELLAKVRHMWPNLRGSADDSTEVLGAMGKVLESDPPQVVLPCHRLLL